VETDPAPAWALEHYREGQEESRLRFRSGLLEQVGLREVALVSVEGAGAYLADLEERWRSPTARAAIVDVARRLESVPELLGVGPHLLLVGQRT